MWRALACALAEFGSAEQTTATIQADVARAAAKAGRRGGHLVTAVAVAANPAKLSPIAFRVAGTTMVFFLTGSFLVVRSVVVAETGFDVLKGDAEVAE